jgi:hypothetical protein
MKIRLLCKACNAYSVVTSDALCKAWEHEFVKAGASPEYAQLVARNSGLRAYLECAHCDQGEDYDTPLFRYIFRVMFDEYLASKKS